MRKTSLFALPSAAMVDVDHGKYYKEQYGWKDLADCSPQAHGMLQRRREGAYAE